MMEFGANFFDAAPETWADVPIAQMRALARQQAASGPTVAEGFPEPSQRANMGTPQVYAPPPVAAPIDAPQMEMQDPEWLSILKGASKIFSPKKKDPRDEKIDELEKLIRAAKGTWMDSAPDGALTEVSGATARPRVYSPMDAPDTGEIDTRDLPEGYFARNRQFESGGNSKARNPITGASGSYQFLPSTWRGLMKEAPHLGLTEEGILDDKQQDAAMRYYTGKSAAILRPLLGRAPTGGELYLAHLLGHSGGPAVIRGADRPLSEIVDSRAIEANPWLKNYVTGQDLIEALNRRFG